MITIINMMWLWVCLAPALLILAIVLIKFARNSHYSLQEAHRHDFDYRAIKLEKILLNETDINTTYEIRDTYKCKDCEEMEILSHEYTYGK